MIETPADNGQAIQRRYGTLKACLRGPWTARCIDTDGYTVDTTRVEAWALNAGGTDTDPGPVAIGVHRAPEVDPGGFNHTLYSVTTTHMTPRDVLAAWWRAVAIADALNHQ